MGDRPGRHEPVELPHDLLRPADREGGDEEDAAPGRRRVHRLGEEAGRFIRLLVLAPAVGRLHHDDVRAAHDLLRVAQDRRPGPAEVPGEDDPPRRPTLLHVEHDDRGAQDVPRVVEGGGHPGRDLDRSRVVRAAQEEAGGLRVVHVVERLERFRLEDRRLGTHRALVVLPFGHPRWRRSRATGAQRLLRPPAPDLGLLRLDLPRIDEDEPDELHRGVGRPDGPRIPLADDDREGAAVVEMRVGEEDRIDRPRVVGERKAVAGGFRGRTLEHPAVDDHPCPLGREQELGAGHGGRRAQEPELHRTSLPSSRR